MRFLTVWLALTGLLLIAGCGGGGGGGGNGGGAEEPQGLPIFNVLSCGAVGDGVADDTAAIQNAINAAAAAGGGRVYFPARKYLIAGPFQDPGGASAQILLPSVLDAPGPAGSPMPIVLEGPFPPSSGYTIKIAQTPPTFGTVLMSNRTGGGNMIGVVGPPGSFLNFSNITAILRNLTLRTYPDPDITALNLGKASCCDLQDIAVDAGITTMNLIPETTHPGATGIITPRNNGAFTYVSRVNIVGYYTGVELNEHFNGDAVQVWGCRVGLEAREAFHPSLIKRLLVVWCATGLRATGGPHRLRIDQYNVEHRNPATTPSGSWLNPVMDIDDPGNLLRGQVQWAAVLNNAGPEGDFRVNGGANLTITSLDPTFRQAGP